VPAGSSTCSSGEASSAAMRDRPRRVIIDESQLHQYAARLSRSKAQRARPVGSPRCSRRGRRAAVALEAISGRARSSGRRRRTGRNVFTPEMAVLGLGRAARGASPASASTSAAGVLIARACRAALRAHPAEGGGLASMTHAVAARGRRATLAEAPANPRCGSSGPRRSRSMQRSSFSSARSC
jgi:hypothetical protein